MRNYIAKRFQGSGAALSLDTEALAKYKDIIDLSIGDTDFVTDGAIIEAAFRDAKAGHTHYGDPKGDPELIAAVCRAWEEDFGQPLPRDHVLVSASSCLGMALTMLTILDPGDEVIVFSPYFPMYREQIELAGGVCVEVPTYASEDYAIDEARLRAAVTPHTKAVIFNNPTNPTGMAYGMETMELLARVAKEYDLLIAADEIYTTYLYEGDFRPLRTLPGMAERTITLNSFSKNFLMTGWRVGVILAEPELLNVMNTVNGSLIYTAPSISQRAALQALAMRKDIREKYVTAYRDRIFYAADRIERIPYLSLVRPKGTFYLFPGEAGALQLRHRVEVFRFHRHDPHRHGSLLHLLRLQPVFAPVDLRHQRHGEVHHALHLLGEKPRHLLRHCLGTLDDQLVVYLQQQLRLRRFAAQAVKDAYHGELHHVRRRPLNGHIERDALAERAGGEVARRQLGEVAAAVEERFDIALLLRLLHDLGHIAAHAGKALQIILNILFRLVNAHADVLRERKGGDAVDDAEVDRLGVRAHLLRHVLHRHAEHLRGRDGVDVLAAEERPAHRLIVRDVGEQAQLDLAVIRVHEDVPALGHEHPPQLAAERRARGDILQIRLGG